MENAGEFNWILRSEVTHKGDKGPGYKYFMHKKYTDTHPDLKAM